MKARHVFLLLSIFFLVACNKKEEKKSEENSTEQVKDTVPKEPVKKTEPVVPELVFTVQVGAYKNANTNLANLSDVQVMEESGLFKYRLQSFETYQQAKDYQRSVRSQYQDAFIQALKKGKPIDIGEALK